jgi:hypothetical protein
MNSVLGADLDESLHLRWPGGFRKLFSAASEEFLET